MGQNHYPTWVRNVQVEKAPKVSITVSLTQKKSAKTGQNWPKIAQTMAIFHHKWLILWHKKNYFHQYPVANGFWSTFDPNRISRSTPTGGLLLSLTSTLKQTSSFLSNFQTLAGFFNLLLIDMFWWICRYLGEDITIHEFAHSLMLLGFTQVKPLHKQPTPPTQRLTQVLTLSWQPSTMLLRSYLSTSMYLSYSQQNLK